ncbi:LTA synthase family protein [Fluviispira multicolorata]|uniref:Sulfatase-like hydrolase/transferase n=1 Tax=Fluviispira multicolorata TaxID=2654512 RepID=A0A833N0I1_9BACT|nr:sulfatase-like hydrolase/transferase [Fluviispira multicolorata]KAB8028577.1 sulfatase-like hydrolase/transferase [Fluviispira multicolorata]
MTEVSLKTRICNNIKDLTQKRFYFVLFLTSTFALYSNFLLIRLFTERFLGFNLISTTKLKVHAIASGMLSDFWMAGVLSFVFVLIAYTVNHFIFLKFVKNLKSQNKAKLFFICLFIVFFVFSLHIPYVNFYAGLITPFHLKYLLDFSFVQSSFSSLFDFRVAVSFLFPTLIALVLFKYFLSFNSKKFIYKFSLFVIILTPISQVVKVHLNTRKFTWTPIPLRVNFVENLILVYTFSKAHFQSEPTEKDFNNLLNYQVNNTNFSLQNFEHAKNNAAHYKIDLKDWEKLLQKYPLKPDISIGKDLSLEVQSRIKNKRPLLMWFVIIESFKPEDGKFHYPKSKISFQPHFDSLSESGIAFTNAWTVGSVTRAGQEAVLCGLWTSQYTAAMKELPNLNPECILELAKRKFGNDSFTAFWHAGRLEFDGQEMFWKRHGADVLVGINDYNKNLPKTWWGFSDKELFKKIGSELDSISNKHSIQVHSIMTLTNHSDWKIPSDASAKINDFYKKYALDPSQLTSAYTDEAINDFVMMLKGKEFPNSNKESYWDNSIIFFVNDHGHLTPSYVYPEEVTFGSTANADIISSIKASQANLLLQGGIVEKVLKKASKSNEVKGIKISHLASQADIFPTALDLLGFQNKYSISDSLFTQKRRWPVVVDIGDYIFVPSPNKKGEGVVWTRREALSSQAKNKDEYFNIAQSLYKASQYLLFNGGTLRLSEKELNDIENLENAFL